MKAQKNNETKRLYIALAIILSILAIFIIYSSIPYLFGKEIILQTEPVDPFHPFMGQYMDIGYEISSLENGNLRVLEGDTVYVSLKEDEEGIYRFESISRTKPTDTDFIKGTVQHVYGNTIRIEYGIESYYFERRAKLPTENITMKIALTSSGRAKISEMLQNGEPVKIEYEK